MINDKIAQLYTQTEKQPQTARERNQAHSVTRWYNDPFLKKVIIFFCIVTAITAISVIVFSIAGYIEMKEAVRLFR